jgi:hypothetical protein
MEFSLTPAGHVLLDRVDELIELKLITSGVGPLRQILQRKRMSAFGGRAAVTQTPYDVAV